jgi:protein-S-isoprenylcysteine O-methyltransferase Ste14
MTNLSAADVTFTGVQFLLFLIYFFDIHFFEVNQFFPDFILGIITALGVSLFAFAVFQLGFNLSPFPRPKSSLKIIKTGVFKYIRHPIYTGLFISLLAYALYSHSSSKIIITILLLIWFYFKSAYEEKLLIQKFPDYMAYKKKTGRFFPRLLSLTKKI